MSIASRHGRLWRATSAALVAVGLAAAVLPALADGDGSDGRGDGRGDSDHDRSGHDDGRDRGGNDRGDDDSGDERGQAKSLDQDEVRAGVARGEFVALNQVLRKLASAKPGRVVAVDLTRRKGRRPVYDIVLIAADGRYWRAVIDAGDNTILKLERR